LYKEDFGKKVTIIYIFDGTGSIDYAKLEDGNEQIVFEDNFLIDVFKFLPS